VTQVFENISLAYKVPPKVVPRVTSFTQHF